MANNLNTVASVYDHQENWSLALAYYQQSLALFKSINYDLGVARLIGNIGHHHMYAGEFDASNKMLKLAIELSHNANSQGSLVKQYLFISELKEKTGHYDEALIFFKNHIMYRDSMNNQESIKEQTRLETKYEFEKVELIKEQTVVELLRQETIRKDRRNNLQYSIIFISLLLVFGGVLSLGFIKVSPKVAEGLIFFSFLILFEFVLVLADPYVDRYSEGAPGYKLLFNALLAGGVFPLHAWSEKVLKIKLIKVNSKD